MSYNSVNEYKLLVTSNITNTSATMQPITELTFNVTSGLYRIEFYPLYDVDATVTGVGFNFQGGTAVLSNFTFRCIYPTSPTTNFQQNTNNRTLDWAGVQTASTTDNRATVIAEFSVTTPGSVIPHFKTESVPPVQSITLKADSYLIVKKLR